MKNSIAFAVVAGALAGLACSSEPVDPKGPSGGTSSSGGSSGSAVGGSSGAGSGTGGSMAGSGGSAGAGKGGTNSVGGSAGVSTAGTGGAGSAGVSGAGAAGNGGAGSGGGGMGGAGSGGDAGGLAGGGASGGSAGAAGGAAGSSAGSGGGGNTRPSPGCEAGGGRPAGGTVSTSSYYFTFPETYDGQTPFPVLIGFHGCGGVNRGTGINDTEYVRLTRNTPFEDEYVVAVPISQDTGGCWNYGNDIARVRAMYDDLVQDHCVDQGRFFATGHSSGANFIGEIQNTQHTEDAEHIGFKGIAPVAGSPQTIGTPVPVMYIQGIMDAERNNSDGANVVERFRSANMCMDTYTDYSEVMGCQSRYNQAAVDPGCRLYDGCSVKTVWCRHNDGDYNGTMHGVPCFAMQAMHDFFQSLP